MRADEGRVARRRPTDRPPTRPRPKENPAMASGTSDEQSRRKAMLIRAGIYIFATHLFAGFVLLLFTLGDRH
ncbi:DUF6126 family protein [Kitasatospora sp. NPDC059327]|uniref:DUF6126 family protein n=1 Tax=Kitasatospora sp. NPDC059327 TaxID=3346803 RepID=UPI003673B4A5